MGVHSVSKELEITMISDMHMNFPLNLPGGDILIIAGDSTYRGLEDELRKFNKWMGKQDYSHIVVIAGNHDFMFERDPSRARSLIDHADHYLNDSEVTIEGIRIWGSPITPWFHNWAFNRFPAEISKHWGLIPDGVDIIVTHGPPHGIGDDVNNTEKRKLLYQKDPFHHYPPGNPNHQGCPILMQQVLRIKPKIHLFGHIHEGYGIVEQDGIKFINASRMDEHYNPINAPIHLKFKKD